MRTVIFILGMMFLGLFMEHWGIKDLSENTLKGLTFIFYFAIWLDIVKN